MRTRKHNRQGATLVLVAVAMITLFAFVALAIDLGMLAVARTQLQDAADVSALAGVRTLNGNTSINNNYANAAPNAVAAATANTVLSKQIAAAQVNAQVGRYVYVPGQQRFEGVIPGPAGENWSMVISEVSSNVSNNVAFAKVFNFGSTNLVATATAVHRPRDVAIVLDFSGSLRFGSLTGIRNSSTPYSGSRQASNNPDGAFPKFGHHSAGGLQASSFTNPYDPANITSTSPDGRAPVVEDFYTSSTGTRAFFPASDDYATDPDGDKHLKRNKNTHANWCTTVGDLLQINSPGNGTRDNNFETQGYAFAGATEPFQGYTMGPGYWGKTFFIWPPDPTNDWRKNYFIEGGSNARCDDNSRFWDSSGNWKRANVSTTYRIDYAAILNFIKNVGPNPFPSRLQSGRILYYDAIPDNIDTGSWPPSDMNQRFWKDYIDYVIGVIQTGSSTYDTITGVNSAGDVVGYAGYGPDQTFGTIKITAKSTLTGNPKPYIHYADNPKRPRTHFWFGPLTMIDFLGNYNMWSLANPTNSRFCWWPGTCHESPMYACKLGIRAALEDIETNHPNNLVSLIYFSTPNDSSSGVGRFNRARVGLGRNYSRMIEALWYPPSTLGTNNTVRPYHSQNLEVPRAMGGTCYSMGLMLAFNQFSTNTAALTNYNPAEPPGDAGGNGRRGAQKVVIFETDGMPNTTASATLQNGGAHNSYYRIRYNSQNPGASEFPTGVTGYTENASTVTNQIYSLCTRITALETASPPGYSTPSKRAQIHCIGFGPVFAPGGANRAAAISTLNQMQTIGNVTDGMPDYKIIYGTEEQMVDRMQKAFTQILQNGVQVSLIH